MEKSPLYTRTGDAGTTALVGGKRVSKTDPRLEAYGTVDELNSHLGVLAASPVIRHDDRDTIIFIQNKLFNIGAYLATDNPDNAPTECVGLGHQAISRIETEIDRLDNTVPPLNQFVLPGGSPFSAQANVARTVCRRCERRIIALQETTHVDSALTRFINRLSDYLFVLGRYYNNLTETPEIFWDKNC
ncbi:MAG: cob(I)yrinic acid a,c-diamide adenosyltransferase [Muribaculaceae bacterium]|nr:cob(I)yrinic acid a,c-diamide adenosyltransferase [Muribaculaceae bacterium]